MTFYLVDKEFMIDDTVVGCKEGKYAFNNIDGRTG
jgi:hypothetical protein